jgi:hypothetical protein
VFARRRGRVSNFVRIDAQLTQARRKSFGAARFRLGATESSV